MRSRVTLRAMPTHTTSDGTRLNYELHGDGGEPLLLIMGLGGTLDFWQFQTPVFARTHRVAVYDNRGMGRSDKPPGPYDMPTLAADALAILDAAGFDRAHVLGMSMGGMIAQELALRHPDRIGALALACTFAKPDDDVKLTASAGVDPKTIAVKDLYKIWMSVVLSPEFIARERQWLRGMRDRVLETFVLDGFLAQLAATMKHDTTARLGQITAPTLVFTGTADKLIPPASSDLLAQLIPGAKLVKLEGGSHGFNVEMPDRFNEAVLGFFAAHPLDESRF
jgi:pimeloyl-ACP methyl ester carboxylesterase